MLLYIFAGISIAAFIGGHWLGRHLEAQYWCNMLHWDKTKLEREVELLLTDVEYEAPHACGQHARVNGLQLRKIQSLLGGEA